MWMLEQFYDELTKGHPDRTQIEPVNITAAANWFYEDNPQSIWNVREDFPATVPPFPYMWMEFKSPKKVNNNGHITNISPLAESVGCASVVREVAKEDWRKVIEHDVIRQTLIGMATDNGMRVQGDSTSENTKRALLAGREARWIAFWNFFAASERRGLARLPSIAAYIDPQGLIVPENYIIFGQQHVLQVVGASFGEVLSPFLFATSLMHAKNVSLEADPLPAAIAKRRAKEGKPAITFKVLQINPIRRQSDKERSEGETGAKRAMHIVRGHFKDYREGAGLFGRLKGLYWWDMHVAGDKTNGQVIKDYTIAKVSK